MSDLVHSSGAAEAADEFPAVFTMHTVQGPTHCCVKHARMVENLFRMLGAYTNATKAPDGAQCENCANEAAASGSPRHARSNSQDEVKP